MVAGFRNLQAVVQSGNETTGDRVRTDDRAVRYIAQPSNPLGHDTFFGNIFTYMGG